MQYGKKNSKSMSVSLIINIIIFMNVQSYRFSTTDQKNPKDTPPKKPKKHKKNPTGQALIKYVNV